MKQLNVLLNGEFKQIDYLINEIEELGHTITVNELSEHDYDCIIFSSIRQFTLSAKSNATQQLIINDKQIILVKSDSEGYLLTENNDGVSIDDIVDAIMALSRGEFSHGVLILLPINISAPTIEEDLCPPEAWNNTWIDYLEQKVLQQLFEEQVQRTPDNIALVYDGIQLSYTDLNKRANCLAAYLRTAYQIKGDDLVALCLDRSEYMLIAILGVLKAGGAYIPLDPSYPDERISYVLSDTKASVLLTNEVYREKLNKLVHSISSIQSQGFVSSNTVLMKPHAILAIDNQELAMQLSKQADKNPSLNITSCNLAYVIYTSGTTGKPKGVMLEHRGIVNLSIMQGHLFGLEPLIDGEGVNNCLLYANYVFDAFVSEMFTALTNGHCAHLLKEDLRQSFTALAEYIEKHSIHLATIPPALLIPDSLLQLKQMVVAGEQAAKHILDQYLAAGTKIINAYGPTEATVCASLYYYTATELNSANIGRPIPNTTAYILDENLQQVMIGNIGELYVGGVNLARGYLNLPELTAQRFINNPFQTVKQHDAKLNSRLYKTGDLARYYEDGSIEYLGRNDFQVKIRGFRIELGEIETKLASYQGIKQVAVLAHDIQSSSGITSKYLAAFYVAEAVIESSILQAYLISVLPDYMIPNVFMQIAKLPMTMNGKLDRNSLLNLLNNNLPATFDYSSYHEIEAYLANLWQELIVTNTKKIELTDSFLGLGGHSLLVTHLILKIKQQYQVILTPHQIYAAETLQGLADLT